MTRFNLTPLTKEHRARQEKRDGTFGGADNRSAAALAGEASTKAICRAIKGASLSEEQADRIHALLGTKALVPSHLVSEERLLAMVDRSCLTVCQAKRLGVRALRIALGRANALPSRFYRKPEPDEALDGMAAASEASGEAAT